MTAKKEVLRRQLTVTPVMHAARLSLDIHNLSEEINRLIQLKKKSY